MFHLCNVECFRPKYISTIVHNLDISVLQALRVYLGHGPPHSKRHVTRARLWILLVLPDRLVGQPLVLLFPQRSSSHCRLPLTILALMEIGNCWNLISNFVVSTCFLLRADIVSDLCRFLIVALLTTGKRGWNSWEGIWSRLVRIPNPLTPWSKRVREPV